MKINLTRSIRDLAFFDFYTPFWFFKMVNFSKPKKSWSRNLKLKIFKDTVFLKIKNWALKLFDLKLMFHQFHSRLQSPMVNFSLLKTDIELVV